MLLRGHLKLLVLKELKEQPMTGYKLMTHLETELGRRPSPGSIYPLLESLLNKKLVLLKKKENKKIYFISRKGEKFLVTISTKKKDILDRIMKMHELLNVPASQHQKVLRLLKERNQKLEPLKPEITNLALIIMEKINSNNKNKIKQLLKQTTEKIKRL